MNIGILGCGYVGSLLSIRLKEQGHHLQVTTTTASKIPMLEPFCEKIYVLKASQPAKVAAFLDKLDALFVTVAPHQGVSYEDTYFVAAKAVQNALKNHGQSIRFIGYTSTTSVYGHHEGAWVDESSKLHPISPNSECLVKTEGIYKSLENAERNVCILRLGEIYGPGRELENRVRRVSGSTLPGKGCSFSNLIHLEDIVGAFSFCLKHSIGGVFNLCNHTHLPRKELYISICQHYGWPAPTWDNTEAVASFKQNKRVRSSKIEALGYRLQYPIAYDWLNHKT